MITKEGSTKIINFMTPGVGVFVLRCGHISYIVKIYYFFKIILLYSQAQIRETEGIVMMSITGRDSYAGVWSYIEHAIFLLLFLFTQGHGSVKLSIKQ